jgi:hypothetical protein
MEKHLHMAGGQVSLPPPGTPDHLLTTSNHAPANDTNLYGARTACVLALNAAARALARLLSTVCTAQTPCQKYWPELLKLIQEGTLTPWKVRLLILTCHMHLCWGDLHR